MPTWSSSALVTQWPRPLLLINWVASTEISNNGLQESYQSQIQFLKQIDT